MNRAAMFFATALLSACDGSNPNGPSASTAIDRFVAELQQQGATATRGEMLPRASTPYFSTNANVLVVNGSAINVFEYPTEAAAAREAGTVSATDCSIGNTKISWISPPRFYRRGSLIAIYAGSAAGVTQPLDIGLGAPFVRC